MTVTTKRVLKPHSKYIRTLKILNGIGCFDGTFSLQLKLDSKPYQVPLRCLAYALQKPFKEELEMLQKQDMKAPLGVDEDIRMVQQLCASAQG